MNKGKLIVMEGACDGIGKSTQIAKLCNHLKEDGLDIVYHHFPSYGTYQGAPVEKYLSGDFGNPNDVSPYFVNSLYAVDRAITWQTYLKKCYEEGKIILLDRYTTSSLIYQSASIEDIEKRKQFIKYIIDFEYEKIGIKEPDNVIFLYAPFDLVMKIKNQRQQNEGIINDIHERNLEFMKKVYDNAMMICDYLSWDKIKCNNENSFRAIDDIHNEVYDVVKKKILK